MPTNLQLPIYELQASIVEAMQRHKRLIIQAPTGSGKSTQLPQMLLKAGLLDTGQVIILQPRRLATRMLAKRVAEELEVKLGDLVGYQIRLENHSSEQTRILYVTEGVLLRKVTFDPTLAGVSTLVFDEFHERHLYGDITLARAIQLQQSTRPDLRIIVMSATLDTHLLGKYLAPCETLSSEGRTFPVSIRYLPKPINPDRQAIWDTAAEQAAELSPKSDGHTLIFMPGAYEISRTIQALQEQRALNGFQIFPLHGELPPDMQDQAVAQSKSRKIIVSTNVAETSLTIDNVTAVIDSGLARVARYDPHRGINTLLIEKISHASADQRTGRAGRTAPGCCLRLWTEREHSQRPLQELPEVHRLDLSEVVLTIKAAGIIDIENFPWIEKPSPKALLRAEQLLSDLGALDHHSAITPLGRKMLRFPLHPRYARMLIEADERKSVRPIALMAALTQGRSILIRKISRDIQDLREDILGNETESDLFIQIRAWRYAEQHNFHPDACRRLGIHGLSARQVGPLFKQYLQIAKQEGLDTSEHPADSVQIRKCILAGFIDHLARRLDNGTHRCEIVHNRRGQIDRDTAIQNAPLIVAAEINEIGNSSGEVNTLLSLITAIEEPWLKELYPEDYNDTTETTYDPSARRVAAQRQRRFRDLVLSSKSGATEPHPDVAARLLAEQVINGNIQLPLWTEATEQWIARVNTFAKYFPEYEASPIGDSDRALLIEQICYGAYSARDLKDKPVQAVLNDWLTNEQLAAMNTILPERLDMPNGRRSRIAYYNDAPPTLAARIQELYDLPETIALGHDQRLPLKIEVLAPNHRPIQVTDNLANFWKETYPQIKPALSRRYPRHEWR